MTDALQIFEPDTVHKLTDRQQAVHDALHRAGHDGLDTDQAGAIAHELKAGRWAHSRDDRCQFCGKDGKQILERLRHLGLARYRRRSGQQPGAWVAANAAPVKPDAGFGEFPPGF